MTLFFLKKENRQRKRKKIKGEKNQITTRDGCEDNEVRKKPRVDGSHEACRHRRSYNFRRRKAAHTRRRNRGKAKEGSEYLPQEKNRSPEEKGAQTQPRINQG